MGSILTLTLELIEKLVIWTPDATSNWRVACAELVELHNKLKFWHDKLGDMARNINFSLLPDGDNKEWYNTLGALKADFEKLGKTLGGQGCPDIWKFAWSNMEATQKKVKFVEDKFALLSAIHERTLERYYRYHKDS